MWEGRWRSVAVLDSSAIETVNINSLQNIFYQAADFTQFFSIAMRQATYFLYLPSYRISSDRATTLSQELIEARQEDHL